MGEYYAIAGQRDVLAHAIREKRRENSTFNSRILTEIQATATYQVARRLHRSERSPLAGHDSHPSISPLTFSQVKQHDTFLPSDISKKKGFFTSNEYYAGLAERLKGTGGTGIAVGSDQGLDLFIMANLNEMHIVDIDPRTNLVTKMYLELGSRLHEVLGRFPTVNEYIDFLEEINSDLLTKLLGKESTGVQFSKKELKSIYDILYGSMSNRNIVNYLRTKQEEYGETSWIGTNENLKKVIIAYESGKIIAHHDTIAGENTVKLIEEKGVSLIYLSNALGPVRKREKQAIFDRWKSIGKNTPMIIFSSVNINGAIPAAIPQRFRKEISSIPWSFFLFTLSDDTLSFSLDIRDYEEIASGCYEEKRSLAETA